MWAALAEARRGVGCVSPNPAVGAILVQRGRIAASGYHRATGLPHAEIECLAAAPRTSLRTATLYVTLEPCSTTGRTPPCTQAIVRAGVGRVVWTSPFIATIVGTDAYMDELAAPAGR